MDHIRFDRDATPSADLIAEIMNLPIEVRCQVYDLLPYGGEYAIERAYRQVLDQRELTRINARADAVGFRPVPGSTSPILNMPREIRDQIYDCLLRYDEQNATNHSSSLIVWHGRPQGPMELVGARALALANLPIHDEFKQRFAVHAVHYVCVDYDVSKAKRTMDIQASRDALAGVQPMHLHTKGIQPESTWHTPVVDDAKLLEPLADLIISCGELTELMCTFQNCSMSFALHRKIVEAVEMLPNLRRYVVNTGSAKSCAKRNTVAVSWEPPMVEMFTHRGAESYGSRFGGEWRDFVASMSPHMDRRIF